MTHAAQITRPVLPPADELTLALCRQCGALPAGCVGTVAYCAVCADAMLAAVRDRVESRVSDESGIGAGNPAAPRPDHGAGFADLACNLCGAGWVGLAWEQCPYCIDRDERMRNRQRRLLLRPELPDRDDNARPGALEAWGDRLAHGISTGVVTAADADAAWEREQ